MLRQLKDLSLQPINDFFRKDIAGLRAIAVLAVIIFHLNPSWIPGGFVGVDIFFVLSGFLITGILWREHQKYQSINLINFYARRAKRLIPAALFLILTVLVAIVFIYPYWLWDGIFGQASAGLLYMANIWFAFQGGDYFTDSLELPQPFLHLWTLGVEEQFYFVLPVLMIGLLLVGKKSNRRALILGLGFATIASFSLSVLLTPDMPTYSFYLLHTRFWEFAAGGLLAVALTDSRTFTTRGLSGVAGEASSALGLSGILLAFVFLDSTIQYPGYAAALPVVSTLLILAASPTSGINKAIGIKPMVGIGNISYSWYLWHYPPIILLAAFPWLTNIQSVFIAFIVGLFGALVSYFLVEKPFRFGKWNSANPLKVVTMSLVTCITLATVTYTGGLAVARAKILAAGDSAVGVQESITEMDAPPELRVDLSEEASENTTLENSNDLVLPEEVSSPLIETLEGETVLLVGDSHSLHWEVAFREVVENQLGGTLIMHSLLSCPAIDVYVTKLDGSAMRAGCEEHRENFWIAAESADFVILSQAEHYINRLRDSAGKNIETEEKHALWEQAYADWIMLAMQERATIGVIADNPKMPNNPADCVKYSGTPEECDVSETLIQEIMGELPVISKDVRQEYLSSPEKQVFNVYEKICRNQICKASDNGVSIFSDNQHLSEKWTLTQTGEIADWLLALANLKADIN